MIVKATNQGGYKMYIQNTIIEFILTQVEVEYSGTHNSDPKAPLYGRCAYWRIYLDGSFVCKITTPVKSINPKPATLHKLLVEELSKQFRAIQDRIETNEWGQIWRQHSDPYSVEKLLSVVKERGYVCAPNERFKFKNKDI